CHWWSVPAYYIIILFIPHVPIIDRWYWRKEMTHMAVAYKKSASLRLVLYDGDDIESGKPIYKTKSFSNDKTAATADQLYAIAQAVAELQERSLYNVERRDTADIREE